MKAYRQSTKTIVKLNHLHFTKKTVALLDELQLVAPNLVFDGVDFHTNKQVRVPLFDIDLDWRTLERINIPFSVGA